MAKTVCAVIVTYNRKALLQALLYRLAEETYSLSAIVLVDNASSDGTAEMLREIGAAEDTGTDALSEREWQNIRFLYYRSSVNTGGSGGFARAFAIAQELRYDYLWVMDDDVLPDPDCLQELLAGQSSACRVTIPCRYGEGWKERIVTSYDLKNPFLHRLADIKTLRPIETVTEDAVMVEDMTFEGPLIDAEIARKTGLPDTDYFIMYDDTDYAIRLRQYTGIAMIMKAGMKRQLIEPGHDDRYWNWKTYYLSRNCMIFDRRYGKNILVRYLRPLIYTITKYAGALRDGRPERIRISHKAYRDFRRQRMGKTVEPGTAAADIR